MALSPDGTTAYVATSSSGQADVPPGAANSLAVYQLSNWNLLRQIALPVSPTEIVINTSGDHVYGVAVDPQSGAHFVISIDLGNNGVSTAALPATTPADLLPIAVSPDGATLYTGSANKKQLTVLDASTLLQTGSIALTGTTGPAPPVITPDGKTLALIVNSGGRAALDIVNLATQQVAAVTLKTKAFPFGLALSKDATTVYVNGSHVFAIRLADGAIVGAANNKSQDPYRVAITPDGSTLYASDLTAAATAVVDASSLTVTGALETLAGAYQIAFTPQGHGYVLNENGSAALRVDTSAMKVAATVPIGDGPFQVLSNAGGTEIFVVNLGGNLSVIRNAGTATSAIPVSIGLGTAGMTLLDKSLYVLSTGLNSVNPATLEVSPRMPVPLPNHLFFAANSYIAASPVGPQLFIPYLTLDDEGVTGGGLLIDNTKTGNAPLINSGAITGGPLVVSADGAHVFASGGTQFNPPNNTLLDFDIPGHTLAQNVTFGAANYVAVALSKDGGTLYCVDSRGKVDLISAAKFAPAGSISAGVRPSGIAISPDGTQALLTDSASNSITVLDLIHNQVAGTIAAGAPSSGAAYLK